MSTTSPLIPIRTRVRMTALFMPRRNRNCLHMQVRWLHEAPERDPAGSIANQSLKAEIRDEWLGIRFSIRENR